MQLPFGIVALDTDAHARAEQLANAISVPFLGITDPSDIEHQGYVLVADHKGVGIKQTGRQAPGIVRAEFIEGSVDHRRKFGGGKGQMIAKAVGIKAGCFPHVLDATAGLGRDSFVLASLGCRVSMIERSPVVHAVLSSGLDYARSQSVSDDVELFEILRKMQLISMDAKAYLAGLVADDFPDVIYLDPMFPERQKSADVKKEMAIFHDVVGGDADADELLPLALAHVKYRVVVKRPRKAPFLNNQKPSHQLEGKSSRYDIYTVKKLPDTLGDVSLT